MPATSPARLWPLLQLRDEAMLTQVLDGSWLDAVAPWLGIEPANDGQNQPAVERRDIETGRLLTALSNEQCPKNHHRS